MKMKHVKTFSNMFNNWETYIYQDDDGNYFFDGTQPLLSWFDIYTHINKVYYVPLDFILKIADLNTVLKHPLYGALYLAQFGTNEDRKKLRKHEFWRVRAAVAEFGTDEDRKFLSKDSDDYVRLAVIAFGNKQIKNKMRLRGLLADRINLAKFGDDDDRDVLLNDNCLNVIETVVEYGNIKQCNMLLKKYKGKNDSLCNNIIRYIKDKEKFVQCETNNQQQKLFNDEENVIPVPLFAYGNCQSKYSLFKNQHVNVHPEIAKAICSEIEQNAKNNTVCSSTIEDNREHIIQILSANENEECGNKITEHKKYVLNDKSIPVIKALVKYGSDKQREYIMNNYELTDSLAYVMAEYGNHKQREILLQTCTNEGALSELAIHGTNEQRQRLLEKVLASEAEAGVATPHISVLLNLVAFGTDKIKMQLINHPNEWVRKQVARHGNYEHKQLLINDPNCHVIAELIKYGNHDQKQYLFKKLKDGNIQQKEVVVKAFIEHGTDKQRKYFINHPSERMREQLARYSNNKIHKKLIHDKSENVRESVAVYCTDKLRKVLIKDKSKQVRQTAKKYHSKSFK